MRSQRDVLEHAHLGDDIGMLEGASEAARRDPLRRRPGDRFAPKTDLAAIDRQRAADQVEGRALAGAVRPDQPDDLARTNAETHLVDRDEAPVGPGDRIDFEQCAPPLGHLAPAQHAARAATRRLHCGRRPEDDRPDALRRDLQGEDQHGTEDDDLVVAGAAHEQREDVLHLVAQEGDSGGAGDRAVHPAGAAHDRHQQVLDAGVQSERARCYRALEMRIQPAGETGEHGGEHEDLQLRRRHVDAERLGGDRAPAQRAYRPAGARAQQVVRGDDREHDRKPDDDEILARIDQCVTSEFERRDARHAVVRTERGEIAEQVEDRRTPRDRPQRQEMPRQADGDRAEQHCAERRGG